MTHPLVVLALVLLAYMTLAFIVSLVRRDNGTADIAYGIAFIMLAWLATVLAPAPGLASYLIALLTSVWGIRLSTRIARRNHGKPEDFRYKKWREEWGNTFVVRSYLQVYLLQGLVIFIVSLPAMLTALYGSQSPTTLFTLVGVLLWILGFFFEARGDAELDAFMRKEDKRPSEILSTGLWKYTRHPNYFGESTMWWGMAVIAGATLSAAALPVLAALVFLAPLLITFLLTKVSGIPLVEKRFEGNPEWEAYKARTSVFLPLPPKA